MLNLVLREMGGMPALSTDPWKIFDQLDRTLTPMWSWSPRPAQAWPVFDVTHTDDAVVITADVPGLGDDDLSIQIAGNVLTIEGKRERRGHTGHFQRQFTLADGLDADRVEAQLERGVLTVLVPKSERARPRTVRLGGGVVDKVQGLLSRSVDKPA